MKPQKALDVLLSTSSLLAVAAVLALERPPHISPPCVEPRGTHSADGGNAIDSVTGDCTPRNKGDGQVTESECVSNSTAAGKQCIRCSDDDSDSLRDGTPGLFGPDSKMVPCTSQKFEADCVQAPNPPFARSCVNWRFVVDEQDNFVFCSGGHRKLYLAQPQGPGRPGG